MIRHRFRPARLASRVFRFLAEHEGRPELAEELAKVLVNKGAARVGLLRITEAVASTTKQSPSSVP